MLLSPRPEREASNIGDDINGNPEGARTVSMLRLDLSKSRLSTAVKWLRLELRKADAFLGSDADRTPSVAERMEK